MLYKKEIDKLNTLYENAVNWYLDKTDFNPSDWMDEKDSKEYIRLIDKDEESEVD